MSVELLGYNIDNYSLEGAVNAAKELIDGSKVSQVITINPEMFETASKDSEFAAILKESEMVIPDGAGITLALKLTGKDAGRIPGIDFAWKLLEEAALNNIPVGIVGAKEEVISKAVAKLQNEIIGLNITYYHNGYFEDDKSVYNELLEKSPKLILVAMGSPRQEKFIYNAKRVLNPALMVGIGGSLDVWSGNVRRAPLIFRKTCTEWLYRTIRQPSRIKRIFPALPLFIIKTINYKFRGRD